LKKSRPQWYNSRKVGGGGSQLSGSLLVCLEYDRDNLHALRTWLKRNHKHNLGVRSHETMGIQYGHLQQDRLRYREHVGSQWREGDDEP